MRNFLRRAAAIALAAVLTAGLAPAALAQDGGHTEYAVTGGSIYFDVATGLVVGCDPQVTAAQIPAEISGAAVTGIAAGAFENAALLESVTFASTITSIGDEAFFGCGKLTAVVLPAALSSIGEGAFAGCVSLENISVAASNAFFSSIDGVLFDGYGYKMICYPAGRRGAYALPESTEEIAPYAFYDADGLSGITFDANLATIGDMSFYSCDGLYQVQLNEAILSIGECAFAECTSLYRVVLGEQMLTIPSYAFSGCVSLAEVSGYAGVRSIGQSAFANCRSLGSFCLPAALRTIGGGAFMGCGSLAAFSAEAGNAYFSVADGVVFDLQKTTIVAAPAGNYGDYVVPDSVVYIGEGAFYGNCYQGVTFGAAVETIGKNAFAASKRLERVTIPATVKTVGESAFSSCEKLAEATIENGVGEIGAYAFYFCKKLSALSVPQSVTSIGEYAFAGCQQLAALDFSCAVTEIKEGTFSGCHLLKSVPLSAVTSIGDRAFYGCRSLQSVQAPLGPVIGQSAFERCASLESVSIGEGVYSIGQSAFRSCGVLTELSFGEGLADVGASAFADCGLLDKVEFPESAAGIGAGAFKNCAMLTYVIFRGMETEPQEDSFDGCADALVLLCKKGSRTDDYARILAYASVYELEKVGEGEYWASLIFDGAGVLTAEVVSFNKSETSAAVMLGAYLNAGRKLFRTGYEKTSFAAGFERSAFSVDVSDVGENFVSKLFIWSGDGAFSVLCGGLEQSQSLDQKATRFNSGTIEIDVYTARSGGVDITDRVAAMVAKGAGYGDNAGIVFENYTAVSAAGDNSVSAAVRDGRIVFNSGESSDLDAGDSFRFEVLVYDDLSATATARGSLTIKITAEELPQMNAEPVTAKIFENSAGGAVTLDLTALGAQSIDRVRFEGNDAVLLEQGVYSLTAPQNISAGQSLGGYYTYTDLSGETRNGLIAIEVAAVPDSGAASGLFTALYGQSAAVSATAGDIAQAISADDVVIGGFLANGQTVSAFSGERAEYRASAAGVEVTPAAAAAVGKDSVPLIVAPCYGGGFYEVRLAGVELDVGLTVADTATTVDPVEIELDLSVYKYLPVDITQQVLAGVHYGTVATANRGIKGGGAAVNSAAGISSPDAAIETGDAVVFNAQRAQIVSGAEYVFLLEVWDDTINGSEKAADISVTVVVTGEIPGTVTTAGTAEVEVDLSLCDYDRFDIYSDVLPQINWGDTATANRTLKGGSISGGIELYADGAGRAFFNNTEETAIASGDEFLFALEVWDDAVNDGAATCFVTVHVTLTGTAAPLATSFPDLVVTVSASSANGRIVTYDSEGVSLYNRIYNNVVKGPLWGAVSSTGSAAQPGWVVSSGYSTAAGSLSGVSARLTRSNGNTTRFNAGAASGFLAGDSFEFRLDIYDHLSENSPAVARAKLTILIV